MTNRTPMPRFEDQLAHEVRQRDDELIPDSITPDRYTAKQFTVDLVKAYEDSTKDMNDAQKIMFEADFWPFVAHAVKLMEHRLGTKTAQKQLANALGQVVNDVLQASLRYQALA